MSDAAYLFDTGALIDIYRGRERIRPYFDALAERPAYISVVSEAELWLGLRPDETERHEALLRYFDSLPVDSAVARRAGEWMRRYRTHGLGWMDSFIAATAHAHDAVVLTRDRRLASLLGEELAFAVYE